MTGRKFIVADEKNDTCTLEEPIANYELKCVNCGNVPTVDTAIAGTDIVTFQTQLCGPCCWGESDLIDPDNW